MMTGIQTEVACVAKCCAQISLLAGKILVYGEQACQGLMMLRGPVQVRSDCPPPRLLAFLVGEAGAVANEAAEAVMTSKAEEEALLEQARADTGPCRVCAGGLIVRKLSKHARAAVRQPSAS